MESPNPDVLMRWLPLFLVLAIASSGCLSGQDRISLDDPVRDTVIDGARRAWVIDTLIMRLEAGYVYPEKIPAFARELRARRAAGRFDRITSALAFTDSLTAQLQELVGDRHLRVRYTDRRLPRTRPQEEEGVSEELRREVRQDSFGLGRVEVMAGNVGYLEVRTFGYPMEAVAEGYADAMNRLAQTRALIIDIRTNGGGMPQPSALLASYILPPDSMIFNSIYWRPENRTDHFWTYRTILGPRYGTEKPVFILTSARTFSAAEGFAYNLQSLKRVRIVGETTRGGANPGQGERLDDHFFMFVPTGRAINPVTGTNWEGVGVQPEVKVPADQALEEALRLASVAPTGQQQRER